MIINTVEVFPLTEKDIYQPFPYDNIAQNSYLEFFGRLKKAQVATLHHVVNSSENLKEWYRLVLEMLQTEHKDRKFSAAFCEYILEYLSDYLERKYMAFEELRPLFSVGKTQTITRISHNDIERIESVTPLQLSIWAYCKNHIGAQDHYNGWYTEKYIFHAYSLIQHIKNNQEIFRQLAVGLSESDFINLVGSTNITREINADLFDLVQYPFHNYIATDSNIFKTGEDLDMLKHFYAYSGRKRWVT